MAQDFAEHTASMIVSVALTAHPGDPEAAAELALRATQFAIEPEPGKAIICPWHGPQLGIACAVCAAEDEEEIAGPDYPPELETAEEARQDMAEQEAECDAVPD